MLQTAIGWADESSSGRPGQRSGRWAEEGTGFYSEPGHEPSVKPQCPRPEAAVSPSALPQVPILPLPGYGDTLTPPVAILSPLQST